MLSHHILQPAPRFPVRCPHKLTGRAVNNTTMLVSHLRATQLLNSSIRTDRRSGSMENASRSFAIFCRTSRSFRLCSTYASSASGSVATSDIDNDINAYMYDLDVAVVGGGPAGLAVALALHMARTDIKLKVFEASPANTRQGAGVLLNINGIRALEALDPKLPYRLMRDAVVPAVTYQYNDCSGERMPWQSAFSDAERLQREGFVPGLVQWSSMRDALYEALPPGMVEFGFKAMNCVELATPDAESREGCPDAQKDDEATTGAAAAEERRYRLILRRTAPEGAAGEEVAVRARYVIAADGYFSRVRRAVMGDDASPDFKNVVRWLGNMTEADLTSGKVPLPAALDPAKDPDALHSCHIWLPISPENPPRGPPHRMMVVYPMGLDAETGLRLIWSAYAPLEVLRAAGEGYPLEAESSSESGGVGSADSSPGSSSVHASGRTGPRVLARALACTTHLPEEVRALLAATPPERVMEFGAYGHSVDSVKQGAWVRGGVVMVGDAAHTGRPDGQGANLAFEDAAVLSACVREHGLAPQAFHAWEAARIPRVRGIVHDMTPDASIRNPLIRGATFEALWCPLQLLGAHEDVLPGEVAAAVKAAVETGGIEAGREVIFTWSRDMVRETMKSKLEGRQQYKTIEPPGGTHRFR